MTSHLAASEHMILVGGGAIIRKRGEGDRERGRAASNLPSNSRNEKKNSKWVEGGGRRVWVGVATCTVEHGDGLFYFIFSYYACII